jgi:hypothetical protein
MKKHDFWCEVVRGIFPSIHFLISLFVKKKELIGENWVNQHLCQRFINK